MNNSACWAHSLWVLITSEMNLRRHTGFHATRPCWTTFFTKPFTYQILSLQSALASWTLAFTHIQFSFSLSSNWDYMHVGRRPGDWKERHRGRDKRRRLRGDFIRNPFAVQWSPQSHEVILSIQNAVQRRYPLLGEPGILATFCSC